MKNYTELYEILSDVLPNPDVQSMKRYCQHGRVSTYAHCESVAKLSYDINRALNLHADLRVLLVGAMLHDFYLYDWHAQNHSARRHHAVRHAERASKNAKQILNASDEVCQVIASHMWPLNPAQIPPSKEAWVVCIADKCVSLYETVVLRRSRKKCG